MKLMIYVKKIHRTYERLVCFIGLGKQTSDLQLVVPLGTISYRTASVVPINAH